MLTCPVCHYDVKPGSFVEVRDGHEICPKCDSWIFSENKSSGTASAATQTEEKCCTCPRLSFDSDVPHISRDEMQKMIEEILQSIRDLFKYKNQGYGDKEDVFHNFRSTAIRVFQTDNIQTMFKTLEVYHDKHSVALNNWGPEDPEFIERLRDRVVYNIIALAMARAAMKNV